MSVARIGNRSSTGLSLGILTVLVMLQAALFLLGCVLSQYLWEMNTTIASVILGVTSLGTPFYLFIVMTGSAFASYPYQAPGSCITQSTTSALVSATLSIALTFRHAFRSSVIVGVFQSNAEYYKPWWSRPEIKGFFGTVLKELPPALASDSIHLGQAMVWPLVALGNQAYTQLSNVLSTPTHRLDQQRALLDLDCIFWTLQTSLDKDHHLSAMEHLVTMVALPNFDPSLVVGYFC